MNLRYSKVILSLISGLFLMACEPKGEGILNNQTSFADSVDNATLQAPFAYDMAADTISYNSCVSLVNSTTGQSPTLPALTIGANEGFVTSNGNGAVKAGLKLRTDFLQFVGRFFSPQSPATTITPAQVQSILTKSPNNAGSYLQYSVRRKTDLALNIDLISPGANNNLQTLIPKRGRDAAVFLQELNAGYVGQLLTKDIRFTQSGTVLAEGPRAYNLSDTPDPVPIQGSFILNQTSDETLPPPSSDAVANKESIFGVGEFYSDAVRKKFNSSGNDKVILTAVFGGKVEDALPGSETSTELTISQIRRRNTDVSKAYGRGYTLRFEPKVRGVAGWVSNVLSGTAVTEIDLSTGTTAQGVQWTCENFLIAAPVHYDNKKLNEPTCSPLMENDLAVGNRLQSIKKIRRQHSANDWNIGLFIPKNTDLGITVADRIAKRATFELCVSPRQSSCYLPTTQIFDSNSNADAGIQYDTTKECYLTAYSIMGVTYTNSPSADDKRLLGRCPQYLSVCTRTSTNF